MKAIRHSAQTRLQKLAPLPLPSAGLRRLSEVQQPQVLGSLVVRVAGQVRTSAQQA